MAQQITIDIVAETRRLQAGISDANRQLSGIQAGVQNVQNLQGAIVGVGASLGAFSVLGGAIKGANEDASNLQQQFGAIDSVFDSNADAMKNFANNAYSLGLSAEDAARNAVLLGTFLKGAGLDMQAVSGETQNLTLLAADLAATYGGTATDAIESLTSAFRGEFNPIEKYGVSLRKSDINARLAAKGQAGLTGEALKQAEVMATLELIMEKTVDAQGQAARESETFAAKEAELAAVTANLSAQLGEVLLPIMTALSEVLIKIVDFFASLPKPVQNAILVFGGLVAVLAPAALLTSSLITAFTTIKATLGGLNIVTRAATVAQQAFNLVLSLNPLAKIAIVIGVVVSALIYFFTQTEIGRKIWGDFVSFVEDALAGLKAFFEQAWQAISSVVTGVMENISNVINSVMGFIQTIFQNVLGVIKRLVEGDFTVIKEIIENVFEGIRVFLDTILDVIFGIIKFYIDTWTTIFRTGFDLIKGIVEGVVNGIRDFVNGGFQRMVDGVVTTFNNLRDAAGRIWGDIQSNITGFVTNIINAFTGIPNAMAEVGKNIVEGIWSGISGLTTWFRDKILNFFGGLLPGWVKDVLGIKSPSKVFEQIGESISEGTAAGLKVPALRRPEGLAGQTPINIYINAGLGTDPYQLGKQVNKALKLYTKVQAI